LFYNAREVTSKDSTIPEGIAIERLDCKLISDRRRQTDSSYACY
jgi:hypothetical protein